MGVSCKWMIGVLLNEVFVYCWFGGLLVLVIKVMEVGVLLLCVYDVIEMV